MDGSRDVTDLKDICGELDTLSIRVLQLMNELIQCKLNIEKAMKSGSLDLAKARYIMGNRNVSALQLPTEDSPDVTALARVISSKDESSSLNNLMYNLNRVSMIGKSKPSKSNIKQRTSKEELVESDNDDELDESQPLLSQNDSTESRSVVQDPIKWFGVLVPQNLRQGQAWFQKAIELSIQSANIQSELDASISRFKYLLTRKNDYIENVREP